MYLLELDPNLLLHSSIHLAVLLNLSLLFIVFQPDDKYEFSDPTRIQNLVKNYSQFVSFPIYVWQEKSRTVEVSFSFERGNLVIWVLNFEILVCSTPSLPPPQKKIKKRHSHGA